MALEKLVDQFIKEVDQMELMTDPSLRNPPSKHQRIIKDMYDLIQGFKHLYRSYEGKME